MGIDHLTYKILNVLLYFTKITMGILTKLWVSWLSRTISFLELLLKWYLLIEIFYFTSKLFEKWWLEWDLTTKKRLLYIVWISWSIPFGIVLRSILKFSSRSEFLPEREPEKHILIYHMVQKILKIALTIPPKISLFTSCFGFKKCSNNQREENWKQIFRRYNQN